MSDLVVSLPSDKGLRAALGEVEGVEFVEWDLDGPPSREVIDIVVPPYQGGAERLAAIAQVETRLVQWQSIGYNDVAKHLPAGLPFANAATVHEAGTAELALALALASQRGIPEFVRAGDRHHWELEVRPSLADRRVLLVGYGGIGKAIEARLVGFEVEITRVARSARTERNLAGEEVAVHGLDELPALLGDAEILMLAVPLTDGTNGLIDADALVAELQAGRLRAALDVTDPEPLPAEHPLWDCPNVLISPHVGGDSSAMTRRITALILRQVGRMRAGEAPENLIDLS
jgi:phosphoglycerate dehydrogenase-like enzyme